MTHTTQSPIDAAARAVDRAHDEAAYANAHLGRGDVDTARRCALAAKAAASDALGMLLTMGARRPGDPVAADVLRLDQLDTSASRALLAALEAAQQAGEALDRERGWLQDGVPCGWGETLAAMALTLRIEVEGPKGRGE